LGNGGFRSSPPRAGAREGTKRNTGKVANDYAIAMNYCRCTWDRVRSADRETKRKKREEEEEEEGRKKGAIS
jgi:hypothetical protein